MDPGRALCFVLANPRSPPLAQVPPLPPPGAPLLYSGYAGGTLSVSLLGVEAPRQRYSSCIPAQERRIRADALLDQDGSSALASCISSAAH